MHARATAHRPVPMEAASSPDIPVRPAATLILLRDAAPGIEVFLQRRAERAAFLGGAHVFPGGALEAGDADPRVLSRVVGLTDSAANARLSLPAGALSNGRTFYGRRTRRTAYSPKSLPKTNHESRGTQSGTNRHR